jgi:hypothetical protein
VVLAFVTISIRNQGAKVETKKALAAASNVDDGGQQQQQQE